MAHPNHAPARICSNCDGHASVAITLGGRNLQGHLRTVTAHCPVCHGTGTRPARRSLAVPAVSA